VETPGDLFGVRQHGIMPLKLGDIVKDVELLSAARKKAETLIESGAYLDARYRTVREFLESKKGDDIAD
jgi:RecG-like helicase